VFSRKQVESMEHVEEEQVAEFVDEIDEENISIYLSTI